MMLSKLAATLFLLAAALPVAYGHGVITEVVGANGMTALGFGVDPATPRDGTKRNPFQQDSSIIRDKEIQSDKTDACGRTLAGGVNDIAKQLAAADTAGLPTAGADGSVTMTLHQVNGDGAGPYTCDVSADGTGQTFTNMVVTKQVPGTNSRSQARATDFALVAQIPAGTACTGGPSGSACLVRCRNAARAGPFGGCVAVTNGDGAAAGNATAPAAPSAATEGAATPAVATSAATPAAATATPAAAAATAKPKAAKAARDDIEDDVAQAEAEEDEEDEEEDGPCKDANKAKRQAAKRWLRSRVVGQRRAWQWI